MFARSSVDRGTNATYFTVVVRKKRPQQVFPSPIAVKLVNISAGKHKFGSTRDTHSTQASSQTRYGREGGGLPQTPSKDKNFQGLCKGPDLILQ